MAEAEPRRLQVLPVTPSCTLEVSKQAHTTSPLQASPHTLLSTVPSRAARLPVTSVTCYANIVDFHEAFCLRLLLVSLPAVYFRLAREKK